MASFKGGKEANMLAGMASASSAVAAMDWWETACDDEDGDGNLDDAGLLDGGTDTARKRARIDPDFDVVTERSKCKESLHKLLPQQIKECETVLKEGEASYNIYKLYVIECY